MAFTVGTAVPELLKELAGQRGGRRGNGVNLESSGCNGRSSWTYLVKRPIRTEEGISTPRWPGSVEQMKGFWVGLAG